MDKSHSSARKRKVRARACSKKKELHTEKGKVLGGERGKQKQPPIGRRKHGGVSGPKVSPKKGAESSDSFGKFRLA